MATIQWPQGNTRTLQPFTLQNGTGANAAAQDLTGYSTITLTVARADRQPLVFTTLTGTPTVTSLTNGQFTFKFSATDVAVPGSYWLVITVLYAAGDTWVGPKVPLVIEETR